MQEEKPDFVRKIREAAALIRDRVLHTPLEPSDVLARLTGGKVCVKWESEQITGSFKIRGAFHKISRLSEEERRLGIVSASTGNHGQALSYAARAENIKLHLFLPETAALEKRRKIEAYGVIPEVKGASCEKTEAIAREHASRTGQVYVSPYNDWDVIFGAGTVGLEIFEDMPDVEDVVVPVGGGGLISGIAGYLKAVRPGVRLVGVEPENSAFMAASVAAGRVVEIEEKETVADAVAGGIEPWSVTFPVCRDYVDRFITVPENAIIQAMALVYREHGKAIEGAGALSVAAFLYYPWLFKNRSAVAVVSGGNINKERFELMIDSVEPFPQPDPWNI